MDQHERQPILKEIPRKIDIQILPKHQPNKFIEAQQLDLIETAYEEGREIGFIIKGSDTLYEMDYEEGFFEPNGCYYNKDFEPQGWWVLDQEEQEYFYNIDGILDGEQDEDDDDNVKIQQS